MKTSFGIDLFVKGIDASVSFVNFINYRWDGLKVQDEKDFTKDHEMASDLFVKHGGERPTRWLTIPMYWSTLVREMMEKIAEVDPAVAFLQIKEKFLVLTVYFHAVEREKIETVVNSYRKKVKEATNERIAEAKKLGIRDGVQ